MSRKEKDILLPLAESARVLAKQNRAARREVEREKAVKKLEILQAVKEEFRRAIDVAVTHGEYVAELAFLLREDHSGKWDTFNAWAFDRAAEWVREKGYLLDHKVVRSYQMNIPGSLIGSGGFLHIWRVKL